MINNRLKSVEFIAFLYICILYYSMEPKLNNINDWYVNPSLDEEYGDRVHLLHQTNVLDESLNNLSQSRAVLNETNQIGANVMSKLLNQRDSILRTKQLLNETQDIHTETRDIIRSIGRSEFYTRVLLYATIVMLIIAIVFILIYKILR